MTIKQLPDFAFRSATDYAGAMDQLHARYDPVLGTTVVDVMERLSLFAVFRSPWFSAALVVLVTSIVVCTLDRTPRLWRGVSDIRVAQPEPYFDPRLPDRAAMDGVAGDDIRTVLRRNGFRVREEAEADGTRHLYGDRHQYTKMATLLTHLGLILFLLAAAATSRLGDEQGLVVAEGESLTVQPIGTPGLLLVKNFDFEAPGFDSGTPTDFTTDLAVFQDGRQIARKTIRVNDPLSIAGYTFHQNGFGPAPHILLKSAAGAILLDAPVPMTDALDGRPYTSIGIPGRDMGLKLLLDKAADGAGILIAIPYRVVGTAADGQPIEDLYPAVDLERGEAQGLGRPGPVDRPDRFRRVHAADREARPRAGPGLDRVRVPHRRHHDLLLPAASPGLDAARPRRPAGHRLALGPVRRRRARIRASARPARRRPPSDRSRAERVTGARRGCSRDSHNPL